MLLDLREARAGRPVVLATLGFDPMHNEGAMETGAPKAAAAPGGGHEGHAGGAMDGEEKPILRIDVEPTSGYAKKIPATLSRLPAPLPRSRAIPIIASRFSTIFCFSEMG